MIVILNKGFSLTSDDWQRNTTKASGSNFRHNSVNCAQLHAVGMLRRPAFQAQAAATCFQPPQARTAETTRSLQPPGVPRLAVAGINGQDRGNFWFHSEHGKVYFDGLQLLWNYGPAYREWPLDKSSDTQPLPDGSLNRRPTSGVTQGGCGIFEVCSDCAFPACMPSLLPGIDISRFDHQASFDP
jgi:hypothetical protein